VGGGIAGALTALNLLEAGFEGVTLFETNTDMKQS
jgi:glycine/D-amino acid oxidase-like deaminating enzyme